jgi:hypothetical protein
MRHTAGILIYLTAGMALSAISQANNLPPGNPYGSIVKRNIFGLNPVPVVDPNMAPPGPPPPKITLTGITTIFGPAEALFKVAGVKREGKPPQDESYIFTEGESQDDVEVTAIDTVKNVVTFNNHGVVQQIPLVAGVASSGSAPAGPTFNSPRPFGRPFGRPGLGGPGGGGPGGFQRPFGNGGPGQFNNDSGANNNTSFNNNNAASQMGLSGDDQAALIAAQHAQLQAQGNPLAAVFPPTAYDGQATTEASGSGTGQNPPSAPTRGPHGLFRSSGGAVPTPP